MITIKEALDNNEIEFNDFYNALQEKEIGYWDSINSEDIIHEYIDDMMDRGVQVSHILKAIEENPSDQELYSIWLGNSMETPEPINTKEDLVNALELDDDGLQQKIDIK
jgi:hypothetical protein